MKFFLKILGWILVIGFIGWGGYFIYQKFFTATVAVPTTAQQVVKNKAAIATTAPIKLESQNTTFSYFLNSKTNAIYLVGKDGQIFKTLGDGQPTEIVNKQTLPNLNSVAASTDGTKLVATFNYPNAPVVAVYDTSTNTWERLPENTFAAAFDLSSAKLAYLKTANAGGELNILDLTSKKATKVINLTVVDGNLTWQTKDELILSQKPTQELTQESWLINIPKKTISKLTSSVESIMSLYGNATYGLKLALANDKKVKLFLTTPNGLELAILPFVTLPSKCALTEKYLYCAVPKDYPVGIKLPDDYLKYKFYSLDSIVKLNLDTLYPTTLLDTLDAKIDAEQLKVSGEKLLFVNRYDEKIYSMGIK